MQEPQYDFSKHEGENGLERNARIGRQIHNMENDRNEWAEAKIGSLGKTMVILIVIIMAIFIGYQIIYPT